jgi:hypothetical protein
VHVGLDGLTRDLLGGLEERADVDVEAEVGEGGRDDLLAAVVAVLAHLGDEDARAPTLGLLELLDEPLRLLDGGVSCPGLGAVHAPDRTDLGCVAAEDLLQRIADLADRRLGAGGVDGQREQVGPGRGHRRGGRPR